MVCKEQINAIRGNDSEVLSDDILSARRFTKGVGREGMLECVEV